MNLDINYFCTYEEQIDLLKHLIEANSLIVYYNAIKKNKDDIIVKSFDEEIKKAYRRVNTHLYFFFNFDNKVIPREFVIKGEETKSYSVGPSDINSNGIDIQTCTYEDEMILFGKYFNYIHKRR